MNGEEYLSEALQHIINQSFKNWELYFFDNQSTDNSKDIFESFGDSRFKYFYFDKSYDLGYARQKAWKKIDSEYVAICDVDDLSLDERFDNQIVVDIGGGAYSVAKRKPSLEVTRSQPSTCRIRMHGLTDIQRQLAEIETNNEIRCSTNESTNRN